MLCDTAPRRPPIKSIAIIHPTLNQTGGAEKVCLDLIDYFYKKNFRVYLYTLEKTNWEKINHVLRHEKKKIDEKYLFNNLPHKKTSILSWALLQTCFFYLLLSARFSHYCITLNNYGEVFPFIAKYSYIHARPLISLNSKDNVYDIPIPTISHQIYKLIFRPLSKISKSEILLTNSKYNSDFIQQDQKQPIFIIPPFSKIPYQEHNKTKTILTVGRLIPKKGLDAICNISISLKEYTFVIAGATVKSYEDYPEKLTKDIKNIIIVKNPDRRKLEELMATSSIYLSTQETEAFGIAVIEAMSQGCVPLIPKSGGPWIDIFRERDGEVGFTYTAYSEAKNHIRCLFSDPILLKKLAENAERRALYFSRERFEKSLDQLFENVSS